ncbi:sugar transferase [Luteolibacter arcticus]|uniref:Sugar transferase n=1 Tax=Luteolibacter arcticus TaxID=1581411 RepID=A0ABT3GR47_9BACT|nr:sugar transferase [Luteolibacter arcticus]MCW1925982.1 sugar transferase [Luteolibacter arcticus]
MPMSTGRKQAFSIQALQLLDAALVWLGFWLASIVRDPIRDYYGLPSMESSILADMSWVLYIAVPFTPLVLEHFGFYEHVRRKSRHKALQQIVKALAVMGLVLGLISVFSRLQEASRLILGIGAPIVAFLLLLRDRVTRKRMILLERNEGRRERVVLAGSGQDLDELIEELDPEATGGWNIVERFDLTSRPVEELYELLKRETVERVIFATRRTAFDRVAQAVEACELQGVEAWIAASFIRTQIARPVFDSIGNKPMLVLRSTPELSWELLTKEAFDRLGALFLITVSSPLWLIAAIGIRFNSPGAPILFCQKRAGHYGRPFRMWKFRTMVPNAEALLEQIKAEHGNQMDGPVFKLDRDPRIFPFGGWLRKLSIDELPQLLNVLTGEMSLVGPRPLPLYEVAAFSELAHRRRLSVKPGITCEWQAGGRNKITSFEQWVEMDLKYIDNWSLWLDIKILLKTIPAVLLGRGAK